MTTPTVQTITDEWITRTTTDRRAPAVTTNGTDRRQLDVIAMAISVNYACRNPRMPITRMNTALKSLAAD